ncbi:hypothetical protein AVEN_131251-1 [Araneus ventricosus]|uniref:Uncharacterized protein n=1 Tax=Araneus ventricosus TaxID=182803 RepID=A0A4Y2LUW4_ARAVE|nr:hypothetical protein AVEN_131251-1 [Araneus ventricosus]
MLTIILLRWQNEGRPTEGRLLERTHASLESYWGPDGTTHHGAQQGKAVTGSEHSEPLHLPWCWPEPICSGSSPGTLTTLNANLQRMTLSLDPYQTNQTVRIKAELIHWGPTVHHPSKGSPRTANTWGYFAVHEKQETNGAATTSNGTYPLEKEKQRQKKTFERVKLKEGQALLYLDSVKPGDF